MSNPPRPSPPRPAGATVKDTIESVLVAFILAFVFRAFVVEAYVIPTGSMAPTLLGANMRFRCEDCGYEFTVNYMGRQDSDETAIPSMAGPVAVMHSRNEVTLEDKTFNIHCPNCGYKLSREQCTNPQVQYGDRILVLKYLYLFQQPSRWDVVVFKSPDMPFRYDYQQNYIKRLVGKPGEQLVVLDGDVYVRKSDHDPFIVQTKPRAQQDALWRIIYNNDYYPQGLERYDTLRWTQPWKIQSGAGWDLGSSEKDGRVFHFSSHDGSSTISFDPEANPGHHAMTDWLAYDVTANQGPETAPDSYDARDIRPQNIASDLKLDLFYTRKSGTGPLVLQMSKIDHVFTAIIAPGSATVTMHKGAGQETVIGTVPLAATNAPMHIEFQNVDYQVTLRIDSKDVIISTPAQYHPDFQALLDAYNEHRAMPTPSVKITAAQQESQIEHLALWRDVYYTNRDFGGMPLRGASPEDFPNHITRLGTDEYFVLGDNSLISGDARYWTDPVHLPAENLETPAGRVPGRFMLGKAFFVYWPAGFRPTDRAPGVIPNFGEMRFIH